jgi:hypothetical protein
MSVKLVETSISEVTMIKLKNFTAIAKEIVDASTRLVQGGS